VVGAMVGIEIGEGVGGVGGVGVKSKVVGGTKAAASIVAFSSKGLVGSI